MEDKLVYNKSALPLVSKVEDGWRFLADRHKLIRGTIAERFVTGQVVNRTRYVSGRRLIYYGTNFFSQVSSFFAYCRKNLIVDKLNFMKGKEERIYSKESGMRSLDNEEEEFFYFTS